MIGIYKITSPSGKVYIGQSVDIEKRFSRYINMYSGIINQTRLYNSLKKYGPKNHKFEIIEECNENLLNEREIFWINFHNSTLLGLNIRCGGEGGGKLSNDTKIKISRIHKGLKKPKNQKFREQISQKLRGRKIYWIDKIITKERNEKIKESNKHHYKKGSIRNKKISNKLDKYKKKIIQYNLENQIIKEHQSINSASNDVFGNNRGVAKISNNLNGLSKTCGGFIFKFKVQENQLIPKYRISGKK